VATALVSIPVRYMHTSTEVVAKIDVERAGKLVAQFAAELVDLDFLIDTE
jgi:endoglucanase